MALYLRDTVQKLLRTDQKIDMWYEFRVPLSKSTDIWNLVYGDAEEEYGVYFWRKEELTDEHGVFDADRAKELYLKGEGRVLVRDSSTE